MASPPKSPATVPPSQGRARLSPAPAAHLELVLDQAPDAFVALAPDGRVAAWNRAATEMFGWTAQEAVGRRLEELIIPEHLREAHNRGVDRALRTDQTTLVGRPVEVEAVHRDGTVFPVELKIGRAEGDERVAFTAFLRDMSERRAADAALREAEERFRSSFDCAPIGMALVSPDGRCLKVNEALCSITGYSGPELLRRPLARITHPEDLEETAEAMRELATEGRNTVELENRYLHANGHIVRVQVNASAVRDAEGRTLHVVAQIQDVSARRRADQYTAAQHAVSRILVEAPTYEEALEEILPTIGRTMGWVVGALWAVCPGAQAIRADRVWSEPGFEQFATISRGFELPRGHGLPGKIWNTAEAHWIEALSEDRHFARREAASRAGLRSAVGLPILGPDGLTGVMEFFSDDVRPPEPELLARLAAIGSQIGQFIERQRAEREADRLKTEFFALVSHELRTPLTSMVGYLELLMEDDSETILPPHHRHFLDVIQRNAGRLQRLVGDLLFAAQLEAGNLSLEIGRADLGAVVREAVQTLRHRAAPRSVELVLDAEEVPVCAGDHDRIGQAVDNLLSNALKYTPEGGRVRVALRHAGARAAIEIEDSGIGIPEAEQDRLFERFFRASSATDEAIPGVGLGLSIVRAIVEGHGGTVGVRSKEGLGSTFTIELPLETPIAAGEAAPARREPAAIA